MTPTRLPRQIDLAAGPSAGEQRCPREAVHPGDVRFQRGRQDAGGGDHERGDKVLPRLGPHHPVRGRLVERHRDHGGAEADVATQIELVGHEVQIRLDLGLGRHRLGPHPLLLDLLGEAVGVLDALDVAARAGIPVEQPCATDVFGLLQYSGAHTQLAEPVQHVEAGESGADDDCVEAFLAHSEVPEKRSRVLVRCSLLISHSPSRFS